MASIAPLQLPTVKAVNEKQRGLRSILLWKFVSLIVRVASIVWTLSRGVAFGMTILSLFGLVVRSNPSRYFNGRGGCRQINATTDVHLRKGECVAIIGANSGIGKELAMFFGNDSTANVHLILTRRSPTDDNEISASDKVLLQSHLDLEVRDSITNFVYDTRRSVRQSCPNGRLGYLFLNAAQMYAPGYDKSYSSKDGRFDRLFSSNFEGYVRLIHGLIPDVLHHSTRVVFVSSIAHFHGIEEDVFKPNLKEKISMVDRLGAYATSKLAFTALQSILVEDGTIPNSVIAIPGAVDTPISIKPKERHSGGISPYPFFLKVFDFTAKEGASFILQAAFLSRDALKPGEIVQPYFYPFADSWQMRFPLFYAPRVILNTMSELFIQKFTYSPGKLWICPASKEARSQNFKQHLKDIYDI